MHRDTHITNLRNLNLTTPGECDGFCVNRQRTAVPLSISGGQVAIFEVRPPWKLFCYSGNWSRLECPCPVFSALSLADCLTEPSTPSRTLLTWLISVGTLLTHTGWLWVSVDEYLKVTPYVESHTIKYCYNVLLCSINFVS